MNVKTYIYSLSLLVIIVTLSSIILPKGKTQKTIKIVLSFLVSISVLKPILSFQDGEIFSKNFDVENTIEIQDDFIYFSNSKRVEIYEKNCVDILESIGVYGAQPYVDCDFFENIANVKKIEIYFNNSVIKTDKEHIDILREVKSSVAKYFGIDENKVIIYE